MFLPIGPCGQGAFGLLQLAEVSLALTKQSGVWLGGGSLYSSEEAVAMARAVSAGSIMSVSMTLSACVCGFE